MDMESKLCNSNRSNGTFKLLLQSVFFSLYMIVDSKFYLEVGACVHDCLSCVSVLALW